MGLEERMRAEFAEGLKEGFSGMPMEFPEGMRPLGEFVSEQMGIPVADYQEQILGEVSRNLDDEVVDAEIIE